jgi:cytochrome c oxidase assembly factor CtaG
MRGLFIAHAGHWLPQLLYLAPLVVLVVAIGLGRLRERRERSARRREDV